MHSTPIQIIQHVFNTNSIHDMIIHVDFSIHFQHKFNTKETFLTPFQHMSKSFNTQMNLQDTVLNRDGGPGFFSKQAKDTSL